MARFYSESAGFSRALSLYFKGVIGRPFCSNDNGTELAGFLQHELDNRRPMLVHFAALQLRNDSLAKGVMQDTLITVLEKQNA